MRAIFFGLSLSVLGVVFTPVRADECENWLALMATDISWYMDAHNRLPTPMPYTNDEICRAAKKFSADLKSFNQREADRGRCAGDEETLAANEGIAQGALRDFHCR